MAQNVKDVVRMVVSALICFRTGFATSLWLAEIECEGKGTEGRKSVKRLLRLQRHRLHLQPLLHYQIDAVFSLRAKSVMLRRLRRKCLASSVFSVPDRAIHHRMGAIVYLILPPNSNVICVRVCDSVFLSPPPRSLFLSIPPHHLFAVISSADRRYHRYHHHHLQVFGERGSHTAASDNNSQLKSVCCI